MAAGQIIVPGAMPTRDRNGRATVGKLFFYEDGTQTPAPVYATSALTTTLSNPVVSDAAGRFPGIWADDAELFTVVWTYDDEETIKTYSGVSAAEDAVLASVALADAAADEAEAAATEAETALSEIEDIVQNAPDAPSVANKMNRNAGNAQAGALAALGEQITTLNAATDVQDSDLLATYRSTGPLKKVTASIVKDYAQVYTRGGTGALTRSFTTRFNDYISLKDFHAGNGTDATTALANCVTRAAALGISKIYVPSGHYLLTTASIGTAGIELVGDGEGTRFTVGANNSNVLSVTVDRVAVRGIKFEGDGTSSGSANGFGFVVTGADFECEDVWFDGFGQGGVTALASSTTKRGPKFIRTRHRNTAGTSSTAELYIGGGFTNILIEDADMVNASSADRGVLIYDSGTGLWQNARIVGGRYEGYSIQGVACTDEAWTGLDRVYGFTVDGGYFKNIAASAIKAKLSKGIRVVNNLIENCGGTPENAPSGLFGSILLNSIGQIDCSHNTLRANGDGGITINGNDPYPKSYPGGQGLASIDVNANIIEGCGLTGGVAAYGNGVTMLGICKDITVGKNSVRGVTRSGIYLDGVTARGIQFATVFGNTVLDSPDASLYGLRLEQIQDLRVDGNRVSNFPVAGTYIDQCGTVNVGPTDKAGDSIGASSCYIITNCDEVVFGADASCTDYAAIANTTAYAVGQRGHNGAGRVYECMVAGTTGTGTRPTGNDPTAAYVDGTVTWGYVQTYRANSAGISVSSVSRLTITDTARFDYLVGPPVAGTISGLRWTTIMAGSATLAAGTATVTLTSFVGNAAAQPDTGYRVVVTGNANETFYVSAKTTTTFTVTSSNAASTATVDYRVYR